MFRRRAGSGGQALRTCVAAGALLLASPSSAQTAAASTRPAPEYPPWATPPENLVAPPPTAALSADRLRAAWPSDDKRSMLGATRASPTADWTAPARLLTTRGTIGRIAFSPDGKSIAYENPRTWKDDGSPTDHWAFIGVYDLATRQISYVDPSFDSDSDPVWSADGRRITFTRKVDGLADARLTRPDTRLKLAAWTPPAKKRGERFTLASVIAAPFIYPPTPSDDGSAIAYVTREAKSRNLYFMRIGEPARRLASYPDDDGQDMSDPPALSRTGAAIAYVRGGRINRQGDAPNPAGFADMPKQQVWIVGAVGDAPRLLGSGKDPVFTPDDRYVLWRAGGNVMGAALSWPNGRLLGVGAPEEFLTGTREGLRFSPDGSRAAYQRGDAIEVYDFATRSARVIANAGDADRGPVWSPDGKRLAFRREPANSPNLIRNSCGSSRYCGPVVSARPWSIWVADVATLQPRKLWQARPGQGSVYYQLDQFYAPSAHGDQMFWSADDRIAFTWEGDGWRHLYAMSARGGDATLLTPGDGEVESAALSLDRRQIVYATNIGDLGRRHIATVGFDGSAPRALTGGEASQWAPSPLAGGRLSFVAAGWADPPVVQVREAGGEVRTAALPRAATDFPATLLVKPELVDFPASDGRTAFGQLFVPPRPTGCAIIFSHGGIRRQMLPGFHYMDAYAYLYGLNQYLASRGCVVLSVEYRSSIMRGEAFRNAPGWGFAANSELLDFIGAAKYLTARKDVDPKRGVGVYGLSWGGYMTAELLAQHSDLFTVGFDMAGVHTAPDETGFRNSAIGHLDTWKSPLFLAQGDDDMNVDFNQGIALARALQTRRPGVEFKQQALPGQTHDLYLTYEQLVDIYADGSTFLLDHLGKK